MILVGGFAFGLVVGYLSWHATRPGETSAELTLKTVLGFIGSVGGAAVLALFPAGTDLFAAYACGLAVGFFFTPIQRSIYHMIDSRASKKNLEEMEVQADFRFADKFINNNYETIALVISQKFREQPSRVVEVLDLSEFAVSILTKIQILRQFALDYPEWFYYDREGLHIRKEAVHTDNIFLTDPQTLRSILRAARQATEDV